MNKLVAGAFAIAFLIGCGGASGTAVPAPTATPTYVAIWQFGTVVTPAQNATTLNLPTIGGYGGRMFVPPGSGTAVFTVSSGPPAGVPTLASLSGNPALSYATFRATSAFTLNAFPGLALTVPASAATAGTYALNEYTGAAWSGLSNPTWMLYSTNELCVQSLGPAISLQPGDSLTLAITGDFVLPTPAASPSPCPY